MLAYQDDSLRLQGAKPLHPSDWLEELQHVPMSAIQKDPGDKVYAVGSPDLPWMLWIIK